MERQEIDPVKKKEVQKLTMRVIGVMLVVVVLYIAYSLISKNMNLLLFQIMLCTFITVYTVMLDVVEPYRLGRFQNWTIGQREAYTKMMIFDVIGVAAIIYWVIGMSSQDEASILPVVIYFCMMQMKRKFQPEFEGTVKDEPEEEAQAIAESTEEAQAMEEKVEEAVEESEEKEE